MYYVYEYHLTGQYYKMNNELTYEDLYCETCGDSDSYQGEFETEEEAEEFIKRGRYE